MSADGWSECPYCKDRQEEIRLEKLRKLHQGLEEAFGCMLRKEYDDFKKCQMKKIRENGTEDEHLNVKEYYEFYFGGTKWVASGSAECEDCGRRWELRTEVDCVED